MPDDASIALILFVLGFVCSAVALVTWVISWVGAQLSNQQEEIRRELVVYMAQGRVRTEEGLQACRDRDNSLLLSLDRIAFKIHRLEGEAEKAGWYAREP